MQPTDQMKSLRRRMRYVAIIFAVSVAAPLQAAGLEGTSLSTAGNVWTNAVLLPSGTTVHNGDRIETARGASAILWSRTMGRIEIRSGSDVTLGADHLRLHKGAVAGSAVSVLLGSYTIGRNVDESRSSEEYMGEPSGETSADSWFVVSDQDGKQLVAAHRGDVRIERAGVAPVLVPGGSYAAPASEPDKDGRGNQDRDAKDRNDEEKDRKKAGGKSGSQGARGAAAAGGAAGKAAGGFAIGSLSHAASVVLIAGAGAAAVGGTVAAVTLNDPSPSPSQ